MPHEHIPHTVSFADVAHQTLMFDAHDPTARLVLDLIETRWVQRLRHIRQTGNTQLVYMFAEHSRFGHSLGVAYLAMTLMRNLARFHAAAVEPFQTAVAAAALLHDIGHIAPGSHLAATIWARDRQDAHEALSIRVICEDPEISGLLRTIDPKLPELVASILSEDSSLPPWVPAIISGGGWNADRGNWTIVDSTMCSVTYGRYNVAALIDAFRITDDGRLAIHESRLDALTHFFMARDSMYRQVYQHRTLQAADMLTYQIVLRVRDLIEDTGAQSDQIQQKLRTLGVYADDEMVSALVSADYAQSLPLQTLFRMTESWWTYHLDRWCESNDSILSDLAQRLRHRRLFKTIRLQAENDPIIGQARLSAERLGYDPRYYVNIVDNTDKHRGRTEQAPLVVMDSGELRSASESEPLIAALITRPPSIRRWVAVPAEVKADLGRTR